MAKYLNYTDGMTEAEFMYWLDISTERSALAESEAKGERKKAIETARKMMARNYPIEDVAELTGLSAEEIAELG